MRATNRKAQQSGYESTDALRKRRPPAPSITPTAATSNEYDAISEYAAALEEQVTALQALDGAQSVASDFASSTSTINTDSALLKEMRAKRKEQAVQMKQLTAMVAAMKGNGTPSEPNPCL